MLHRQIKIKTRPASDRLQEKQGTSSPTVTNYSGQSAAEPQTQPPLKNQDSDRTEYVAPVSPGYSLALGNLALQTQINRQMFHSLNFYFTYE